MEPEDPAAWQLTMQVTSWYASRASSGEGRSTLCELATIAPARSGRTLFVGAWICGLLSADPDALALVLGRMLDGGAVSPGRPV